MSLSSQGCRESKPPVKGCGVVPTALLLFQQLGRFMSKYFNLGREIVGLVSEGNLREKFFEVSHHRVITSSTLAGQYSSFKAFFHCQWKGKMAHQFFYYNMLLNFNNTAGSSFTSQGGERLRRTVQLLPCPIVSRRKRIRRCRRWQQRSLKYRTRRTAAKNRRRRSIRLVCNGLSGSTGAQLHNQSNVISILSKSITGPNHSLSDTSQYFRRRAEHTSLNISHRTHDFQRRRRAERGGGSHDLIPRHITPFELAPGEDDVLPLDNDEDWYPLYVLQASRMTDVDLLRPYTHEVIPREIFQDMPLASWRQAFSSMGVPFTTNLASIKHLLPKGSVVSCGYPARKAPNPDISAMSLEDALTHTRVVYHRLARLQKSKAKIKRQLGKLYGRRCKKSPRVRQIAIDELTAELYRVRTAIQQYDDLHKRLCRKTKSRVREVAKRLPRTIRVPLTSFAIPTSNPYTLLDEDTVEKRVAWSDMLEIPSPLVMGEVDNPSWLPVSTLDPSPADSPLDTLMHLRRDMVPLAPVFGRQAPTMGYGVVGCYKDVTAGASCTLTIMTLNANGLTSHKLPYLCSLLQ